MGISVIEDRKARVRGWFEALRDDICAAFERVSLQPMDGPDIIENTARAVDYCLRHPQWRLSLQTHKTLGIR